MILPLAFLMMASGRQNGLPHNTFAKDEEGWAAVQLAGAGAKAVANHDPANLKIGTGSLAYTYKVGIGQISMAMLPIPAGQLTSMNSMHFWVRADHECSLVVTLQEKGGGRYSATCHAPKAHWQEVQLSLADFMLATEADAPKDPNGKLDPDVVEGVSILDLDSYLAQDKTRAAVLGVSNGDRAIYLSDVQFSDSKLPDASPVTEDTFLFDNYSRTQGSWIGFGVNGLTIAVGTPFAGRWLKVDYHVGPSKVSGAVKALRVGALTGKKSIAVEAAATTACQLIVQLEQVNGAKFHAIIDVPGMAQSKVIPVYMSGLTISDDSPDKNAKLDLSQVKQLVVLDISGVTTGSEIDNTLYLGRIIAKG